MGASRRRGHPAACAAVLALVALTGTHPVAGQEVARPTLTGRVQVGDTAMTSGTVVLHHLDTETEGEIDSTRVASDGSFRLDLPRVPDPARQDVYFVSVRHSGILYFGSPVTTPIQLDSTYLIQAFDTLVVAPGASSVRVRARSIFVEPAGEDWRVTELFQIQNTGRHTLVAPEGGSVWRYPLSADGRNHSVGEGDLAPDATSIDDGMLVVTAPITPGERLLVVRYMADEPFLTFPSPGGADRIDVLVREPAPRVEVDGFAFMERAELEEGSTYMRFGADSVTVAEVSIVPAEEPFSPPVEWVAVLLALVLTGAAVFAMRGPGSARAGRQEVASRRDLLLAVARLDEDFEARTDPGPAEQVQYRRRRAELLERIREAESWPR